jgi:hypothetical protein
MEMSLAIPFSSKILYTGDIIYYIMQGIVLVFNITCYALCIGSANQGNKIDFTFYISEIATFRHSIFSSFLSFFIIALLFSLTIVGNIYFINVCGYFPLYATKLQPNGENYTAPKMFDEAKKLVEKHTVSVLFFNSLAVLFFLFLYMLVPSLPKFKDIDITKLLKYVFLSDIAIFYMYTGCSLQNLVKKDLEREEQKKIEIEAEFRQGKRGRSAM